MMDESVESIEGQRISWSGMTDKGRFRKNNEDAFLALTVDETGVHYLGKEGHSVLQASDFIFAVSDGMGGANSGEFASKIAVEMIFDVISRRFRPAAPGLGRGETDMLKELLERIHEEMKRMGMYYEECSGMGATLSLCWITPDKTHFAHVGDSRIYYLPREGSIRQLTQDHTHVAWLVQKGRISAYEAKVHPQRNVLHQSLGGQTDRIEPQFGTVICEPGDRFVICSDGITEAVSDRRIEQLVCDPPESKKDKWLSQRLVAEAWEEAGRDNLTALVVEVGDV